MDRLSQAQRIGQVLMIGVPIDDPSSGLADFGSIPVGGIFLAGRSSASAAHHAAGIRRVQQAERPISGVPLHVSVDQEGGEVQSLTGADFPAIPDGVEQGRETTGRLRSDTVGWASRLFDAGVTLDLAPVADTVPAGTENDNPPIGRFGRQYGSSPSEVAESVAQVVSSMQSTGLGATAKHFPGLGRVTSNTDTSTAAVDREATVDDSYLQPFEAAIAAGTSAVMVSSASYPNLDPDHIAAFSSTIITKLLRQQLRFNGLIISDDLGAAVAVSDVDPGRRAVDFLRAGGDMVLSVDVRDLAPMTAALAAAAAADPPFRARIADAALHVLVSKKLAC